MLRESVCLKNMAYSKIVGGYLIELVLFMPALGLHVTSAHQICALFWGAPWRSDESVPIALCCITSSLG